MGKYGHISICIPQEQLRNIWWKTAKQRKKIGGKRQNSIKKFGGKRQNPYFCSKIIES